MDQSCPSLVAIANLCIVVSIQRTHPGSYDHQLRDPLPLQDRVDECMSAIECLVLSNSRHSASVYGIEVMFMQADCCLNLGQPQKAWLLIHRAIAAAQLLGLHRDKVIRGMDREYCMTNDQRAHAWSELTMVDRFLSIVLGLPSAISHEPCGFPVTIDYSRMTIDDYRQELFDISGHILERNKECPNISMSTTLIIDRELQALDMIWCNNPQDENLTSSISSTRGDVSKKLSSRFWHQQLKVFLHLPFALRSETLPEYQRSHDACFSASRERCFGSTIACV